MKVGSKVKFKLNGETATGKYVKPSASNPGRFVVDYEGRFYTVDDPKNAKPIIVNPKPCVEGQGASPLKSDVEPEKEEEPAE